LAHASLDSGRIEAVLLEEPLLFNTPVVRNGKQATLGYCPQVWKSWE
jgi:arsenate reductase-like glutaredoxin family protein